MMYEILFLNDQDPESTARQMARDVHTHDDYESGMAERTPSWWALITAPELSHEHKRRMEETHNVRLLPHRSYDEARTVIGANFVKITALQHQINLLTHDTEDTIRAFLPVLDPDEGTEDPLDTFVITRAWSCPDTRNPAGYCVYNDDVDPIHDFCRFCGHPEERK